MAEPNALAPAPSAAASAAMPPEPAPDPTPTPTEGEELIRLTGLQVHFPIRGGALDQNTRRVRGYVVGAASSTVALAERRGVHD